MSPPVTLSIVITSFNRGTRLVAAIESVYHQLGRQDQIVIVDDGSRDTTRLLLKPWLNKKSHIKYIRHKTNLGVQHARNTGIKYASKVWISFLDSDDQYLPGALTIIKNAISRYQDNYEILQFMLRSNLTRDTGSLLGYLPPKPWRHHSPSLADIVLKKNMVGDMHRVIKTAIARKFPWQSFNPGHETYHYASIAADHHPFLYLNQVVVAVNETDTDSHSKTRHRNWPQQHIQLYQRFLQQYQSILSLDKSKQASYQKLISLCYFYQKNYPRSLFWLSKALKTYPPIIVARFL